MYIEPNELCASPQGKTDGITRRQGIENTISRPKDTSLFFWWIKLSDAISVGFASRALALALAYFEHLKASANSGILDTVPSVRYRFGE
jgi:hypothetical protein